MEVNKRVGAGHYMPLKITKVADGYQLSIFDTNPKSMFRCKTYHAGDTFFESHETEALVPGGDVFLGRMMDLKNNKSSYYQITVPNSFKLPELELKESVPPTDLAHKNCVTQGIMVAVNHILEQRGIKESVNDLLCSQLEEGTDVDYKLMGELVIFSVFHRCSLPPDCSICYVELLQPLTQSDHEIIFETLSDPDEKLARFIEKENGIGKETLWTHFTNPDQSSNLFDNCDSPVFGFVTEKCKVLDGDDSSKQDQLMALYMMYRYFNSTISVDQRANFCDGVGATLGKTNEIATKMLSYIDLKSCHSVFDDRLSAKGIGELLYFSKCPDKSKADLNYFIHNTTDVTLAHFLAFVGFSSRRSSEINVTYSGGSDSLRDSMPTASTCKVSLSLPEWKGTSKSFSEMLTQVVSCATEFYEDAHSRATKFDEGAHF